MHASITGRGRMPALAVGLAAVLLTASCSQAPPRKGVFPVEGKVFHRTDKTPAAGALVVFRPADQADWPEGFPRGTVADDGTFRLTTYDDGDGAPEGEYAVLIEWPRPATAEDASQDETGEDRFGGAYSNPNQPPWKKQVKAGPNDATDFYFILRGPVRVRFQPGENTP